MMPDKYIHLDEGEEFTLEDGIDALLKDGVPTVLIPCFLTTPLEAYIEAVLEKCEIQINLPGYSRIYLLFQEGISKKKTASVWMRLRQRGQTLQHSDNVQVFSFGNVPTDILSELCGMANATEIYRGDQRWELI